MALFSECMPWCARKGLDTGRHCQRRDFAPVTASLSLPRESRVTLLLGASPSNRLLDLMEKWTEATRFYGFRVAFQLVVRMSGDALGSSTGEGGQPAFAVLGDVPLSGGRGSNFLDALLEIPDGDANHLTGDAL